MSELDKELLEKEFAEFLNPAARGDLKGIAIENLFSLSGSDKGRKFIGSSDKFLEGILSLTEDTDDKIQRLAYNTLINVAAVEENCFKILKFPNIAVTWLAYSLDPTFELADSTCELMSNLTRPEMCAANVAVQVLQHRDKVSVKKMVDALCNVSYNSKAKLHYLSPILQNLSQVSAIRREIMVKDQYVIQKILPFIEFKESFIRRSGAVGILKNCCFDTGYHEWLLSEKVDLLPRLLLPLAGPEEFDDDDMERLPDDLQYLPPDKQREPDPDIRKMLIEAVFKLCTTKAGRKFVKDKNTYVIMREYHKWETVTSNETAMMNLIDILIQDEPEKHLENLDKVEIPEHLQEKFKKADFEDLQMQQQQDLQQQQE
ncbi:hypothetical protein KUTeg_010483, partial [Tegillarca granosa]